MNVEYDYARIDKDCLGDIENSFMVLKHEKG